MKYKLPLKGRGQDPLKGQRPRTQNAEIVFQGQGQGLDTCYSATYMSQTRDQQRFTISEVAADWHEPMVP